MSEELKYDEDMAIRFIRNAVGEEVGNQYSDDEILYVIDVIWDYYERKGLIKLNAKGTENQILDEADLVKYIKKELANDGEILMDPDDLEKIVNAELDYEESLEDA